MSLLHPRMRQLNYFFALSNQEKRILLAAFLVLSTTVAGLHLFGYKRWQGFLQRWAGWARWPMFGDEPFTAIGRTRFLLFLVVSHTRFPGRCLSQSLTLMWLLKRQGIRTDLRIGVHNSAGAFRAHAWLEYNGQPINDSLDVRNQYAVFTDLVGADKLNFVGNNPPAS